MSELFSMKTLCPSCFGTGLTYEDAREVIERLDMPKPTFIISGLGANIRYGKTGVRDEVWEKQVKMNWNHDAVLAALENDEHLELQPEDRQHPLKVSYFWKGEGKAIGCGYPTPSMSSGTRKL